MRRLAARSRPRSTSCGPVYNAGQLGDVVVVHIGNNSPFSPSQFDEMMELMAGVSRVVFVNLKVPRGWEGPNNAVLAEGVTRYPSAVLADWYSASVDHPEFFLDGVHLRPEGVQAYAQLMAAYHRKPLDRGLARGPTPSRQTIQASPPASARSWRTPFRSSFAAGGSAR